MEKQNVKSEEEIMRDRAEKYVKRLEYQRLYWRNRVDHNAEGKKRRDRYRQNKQAHLLFKQAQSQNAMSV